MPRTLAVLAAVALSSTAVNADFVKREHANADGSQSPYVVFVPQNHSATSNSPIILFLHGAGETKGGQKMPVEQGIGTYIKKHASTFPFVTVIPQAEDVKTPVLKRWQSGSPDAVRALAMLEACQKEFASDPKRVYLTGLSMGGYGTWSLAAKQPGKFAAAVPICGGGDVKDAEKLKDLPIWAFHGDKDTAVPISKSREMIEAIKKAGGTPKYTEFPGVGHLSWDQSYATEGLFEWLLAQKLK
jgi:predicted peptidase